MFTEHALKHTATYIILFYTSNHTKLHIKKNKILGACLRPFYHECRWSHYYYVKFVFTFPLKYTLKHSN